MSNHDLVASIAATFPPGETKSPWKKFDYLYVPTKKVSALSVGGTKTILMPYASLLSGASNDDSLMTAASSNESIWEAESIDSWISIGDTSISPMQAADFDLLNITIDPNPSNMLRTGSIIVTTGEGEDIIYIYQDGAVAAIEASQTTIPSVDVGGEHTVGITSNVSWNVFYDADWISVPFASGTGNDELIIVVDRNIESTARTATVKIEGGSASKTITVTQAAYSASSDASLSDLEISQGILTPSFHPGVTNYTVSVANTVSSIAIAAMPNQSEASVSGTGTKNLSVGANSFIITVTAPDTITKINYTIIVTREQDVTPAPTTIVFEPASYITTIPNTGSATVTVSAKVLDQYGQVMANLKPTYSVSPSYSGVTVNSTSGLVTVTYAAAIGKANIQATYAGLSPANAELTLSKAASVPTILHLI